MRLDPNQRRAVEASGSVAVVAGAGTGKTHMLAQRYLHHLCEGGLRPLEVVAVTFTRRAADELRARIRRVVKEALAEGAAGLHPDALLEVEAAPIGTIHALAQRVCQAFPHEAGLPPDAAVLDELDGRLWTAEALDAALERLDAEAVTALPFSLLKSALRTLLADPFRAEAALAKDAGGLRRELEAARQTALQQARGPAWDDAVKLLRNAAGPAEHPAEVARRAALAAVAALPSIATGEATPEESDAARTGAAEPAAVEPGAAGPDASAEAQAWEVLAGLRPTAGRAATWRSLGHADLAAVKAALRVLRDAARSVWQAGSGPAAWRWSGLDERMVVRTAAVRAAFASVRVALAERKRRAALVDFGDLELHAVRALQHDAVQRALRQRWQAILVDEFQDTSPAQARLLELLRGDAPVTMVGDEKQSIYGFRGADVRVFREERRRLADEAAAGDVELGTSYRSHEALVRFVNRVFDSVLGDAAAPLRAARASSTVPGPHVRWFELDARGAPGDAAALAEAERIAQALHALLAADPPLQVDDGDGGVRPLRAGDVAVLARSRASLEALEALAPARGVPVLNAGGGDVLTTPEGLDAQALLAAVVDPRDAPAVLATLRGPYVAASDPAIHALAQAGERAQARWWMRLDASADPQLQAGARLLHELRALQARGASALDLLRDADARTGYTAILANLPNAARRLADHQGMLDLVTQLEAGGADAFALSRRLRRLRAAEVAVPRPPLRSRDAVALMTIHAAKGLEWPVVVLADMARRGRSQPDDVAVDPDLGVTLRWRDGAGGWAEPALYRLAGARARAREAAEDVRLSYVALTRARDLLLLSARAPSGGLLTLLRPGLEAAGLAPEVQTVSAGGVPPLPPLPPVPVVADDGDRFWAVRLDAGACPASAAEATATLSAAPPLPPADPFAASPLFAAAVAPASAHDWHRPLQALASLDEDGTWQRAAAQLAGAALPPPQVADLLVAMTGPGGTRLEVVARWPGTAGRPGVALAAPEELPSGEVSTAAWTWLPLDPLAPDATLPRLRAALAVARGSAADAANGPADPSRRGTGGDAPDG